MIQQASPLSSQQLSGEFLRAVMDYQAAGLRVFPVRLDKTPACKSWKQATATMPSFTETWELFDSPECAGIGVALGVAPHHLACRDFDTPTAYESWATAYPALAAELPTVVTARGRHIYFRTDGPARTKVFDDGELRGVGSYTVLPPSPHPSGVNYTWIHGSPESLVKAQVMDATVFYPTPPTTSTTPLSSSTVTHTVTHLVTHCMGIGPMCITHSGETLLLESTNTAKPPPLPTGTGQRHHWIWLWTRWLKSQPGAITLSTAQREETFHLAWQKALPRIGTKGWQISLRDFQIAWDNSHTSAHVGSLTKAVAAADTLPPVLPMAPLDRLARICQSLARQNGGKFFLSTRDAQRLVGYSTPMVALRGLRRLTAMGLITCTKTGDCVRKHGGKASEYRWIGPPDNPPAVEHGPDLADFMAPQSDARRAGL